MNVSRSRAGVLRGMHWHRTQTDVWHVVFGDILVQLSDQRPQSATRGETASLVLSAAEPSVLMIRPGIVHGFLARGCPRTLIDMSSLCYLVDSAYSTANPDEYGVRWDDSVLGLEWPDGLNPTLSKRDAEAPPLCEYESREFAPPEDDIE